MNYIWKNIKSAPIMSKKKVVVLSGAGMSAESGLNTFRDQGGLWEKHRIEDVATPSAWAKNPEGVLEFYNMRYLQLQEASPNSAHYALAELDSIFETTIVTQNVDDLHERGGSENIIHLHGSLNTCKSSVNDNYVIPMPVNGLKMGDKCPEGFQLRPNIVWFGEMVPNMDRAETAVSEADVLIIIGTSLNVYPAAGLAYITKPECQIILVDPNEVAVSFPKEILHIKKPATQAMPVLFKLLNISS
jgi:NAD-dependent deacetylase